MRYLTLLTLLEVVTLTSGYKILMLVNNLKSHMIYYSRLGQILVSRGHDVTLVRGEGIPVPDVLAYHGINYKSYKVSEIPIEG